MFLLAGPARRALFDLPDCFAAQPSTKFAALVIQPLAVHKICVHPAT
jgi:hypothetical protein